MESQNLRCRARGNHNNYNGRRGREHPPPSILIYILHATWIVVGAPASFHLADVFYIRSARRASARPDWMEGLTWVTDTAFMISSLVMNQCLHSAWVQGGILKTDATRLAGYYLAHVLLNLAWNPIVFGIGNKWAGLYTTFLSCQSVGSIAAFVQPGPSMFFRGVILNVCGGCCFFVFSVNGMLIIY